MNHTLAIKAGKPVRENFLVFGKPDLRQPEIDEVVDSMRKQWVGTGPKVSLFENMVKKYLGAKYALSLNSCTAGLHLSLLATGVGNRDEVITTPMTFSASANVIEHVGAKPVFVDIEKDTMNINAILIKKSVTSKTKAIIPVHMCGRPCDMDQITFTSKQKKILVIEDAAHAFGASYKGKKIGTISDLTCFSFYVTKNLTTGEGGVVTTINKKYAEYIQIAALHGMSHGAWKRYSDKQFKHYLIETPGFKYNMMDIQAAIGIHQLKRFTKSQRRRSEIWEIYNKSFSDLPVSLPKVDESNIVHAHHLYTLILKLDKISVDRDTIIQAIHAENIGIGIHFISLHLHPYYRKKYGYKPEDFPNSLYVSERTISIPFSQSLSKDDIHDVIKAVRKVINYYKK